MTDAGDEGGAFKSVRDVVTSRRTIYDFKRQVPDRELLIRSMDAARWAPNHKHTHPWRFYLLGEMATRKIVSRYREIVTERRGEETARIKSARWDSVPTWFVVTSERSENAVLERENYGACCCTVQNLALVLWSEGIGLKWSTGPVTQDPIFFDVTGIDPEAEMVVGLFGCGYPREIPAGKRPPFTGFFFQVD